MELVERAHQLQALDGWLREAAAGQGRLVLVGGEAGGGKTALLDQFCLLAQGRARVLRGACDALSTPPPLGPLHDIAAEVGGALARVLAQGTAPEAVFRAALTALSAGSRPTIAVIEDAHWADEATFDLLRFLGRRLAPRRTLVLVTYRADEVSPTHPLRRVLGDLATTRVVRRLDLAPLSEAGIRTLAAGSGVDPAALHRLTGGNPFFATEVLASASTMEGGIPATVRDAVLARASRLPPEARTALDVAAVLGAPLDPDLLRTVGQLPAAAIETCLGSGMLIAAGHTYAFRHELARVAIYDAIAPLHRRALHAAALVALRDAPEAAQAAAQLAHHAEAAGDGAAVLVYAPVAARKAAALGANREATAQYARALRWASGLPAEERLALMEAYAEVADLSAGGAGAIAVREAMIALARQAGDPSKEATHRGWLAATLALDGQYAAAQHAADAALAVLADVPDGPGHAWVFGLKAYERMHAGDVAGAIRWGERARALATRLGARPALLFALSVVGEARLTGGEDERGRQDLAHALALAQAAGLAGFVTGTLMTLGHGHTEIGEFQRAERSLREALAAATERGDDNLRDWGVAWLARTRLFQGHWSEATDLAASLLRRPLAGSSDLTGHDVQPDVSPAGLPLYIRQIALLVLGRVRARQGDPAAEAALVEALALTRRPGNFRYVAPVRAARAELAWLTGDPARAVAEVQAALDETVGYRSPWLAGELAVWRWRAGEAVGLPPGAAAPFVRELTGDWAGAAVAWEGRGCPYEAALARLGGDEAALRQALAAFDRLGARPAATIAARRLRALGARDIPRGPRPATRANPAGLTPRELEILPLLVAGRRNAAIATALYLSPKTVEHHVGRILAKLAVRTRGEVAAAAARLGLPLASGQDQGSERPI